MASACVLSPGRGAEAGRRGRGHSVRSSSPAAVDFERVSSLGEKNVRTLRWLALSQVSASDGACLLAEAERECACRGFSTPFLKTVAVFDLAQNVVPLTLP